MKLNAEEDFLVKESPEINFIAGSILLFVFIVSYLVMDDGWSNYFAALVLFLLPAAFFIARGKSSHVIMKINKTGFYYHGNLVTRWPYFMDAQVYEELVPGSIRDNFILMIRYYAENLSVYYTLKIPLSNTQDKAEEEIIAAIDFYYKASTSANTVTLEEYKRQSC